MFPKISVVTPSYNQANFLEDTILSVITQEYTDLEYIIMDGGSNDGSVNIIKKYADQLTYWESVRDRGQSHAINKGWKLSTGEIIAWLNSDDIYLPGALQQIAIAFSQYPDAVAFIGACDLTDENHISIGKRIDQIPIDGEGILAGGDIPAQPSVFLNRRVLDEIGFLNEDYYYVMDWEYWLRIGLFYGNDVCVLIDETLSAFNTWTGGKTKSGVGKDLQERRMVFSSFYSDDSNVRYLDYKSFSFASTYWREARTNSEIRNYSKALLCFLKAFWLKPTKYHPLKIIWVIADFLATNKLRRLIKE